MERARNFPRNFTVGFVAGDDPGLAQTAAGEVCIVVQNQNEVITVENRGCGHAIKCIGRWDRFFPELPPVEVVADQAEGTEVDKCSVAVNDSRRCCWMAGFVNFF